ncbi:tigger transposable element-derived protein 4-like [Mercenaria mercenaria]|uniref:tigger transposable element-derived protein 4-like n=1 Tax=Mercenaria mercenaria TaxID=6596 RepID=UPI00234EFD12|nr:tigger transposable element-derived protein 4-like [Mercenaria mercenaria]
MYKSNKKAWMTGEIFEEWLHWFDRQMKGRKVLLFVDNAPSHPQVNLKNVSVKFLPANTTSLCQPMDQGIIQAMKLKYRKKQLQYVISQMELKQGKSGFDLLKDISVLDAIYWVARAFKEVEISTIVKCFAKCGFQLNSVESESECTVLNDSESDEEEDDNYPIALHVMARQLFDCDFMELLNIDKEFKTCDSEMKDWDRPATELLSEMKEQVSDETSDCEDDQLQEQEDNVCSTNECLEMIEKLKKYAVAHGNENLLGTFVDAEDIITSQKLVGNTKQSKISDFFAKR